VHQHSGTYSHSGVSPSRLARLTPNLRLTVQLVLAARRWRSMLDEHLRKIGQSAARMEALATIAYSPPFTPQIEIAKRIGIEGATLTRMLDSLESDGLVERLPDPSDRRTKHIRVTKAGDTVLDEICVIVDGLREKLLEGVDPAQIDEMNNFLGMLLFRINEGLAASKE
jgi:MarR family transcriptional regulator for hemolysin